MAVANRLCTLAERIIIWPKKLGIQFHYHGVIALNSGRQVSPALLFIFNILISIWNENLFATTTIIRRKRPNVLIANLFMALLRPILMTTNGGRADGRTERMSIITLDLNFLLPPVLQTNFKEESLCITWLRDLRFIGRGVVVGRCWWTKCIVRSAVTHYQRTVVSSAAGYRKWADKLSHSQYSIVSSRRRVWLVVCSLIIKKSSTKVWISTWTYLSFSEERLFNLINGDPIGCRLCENYKDVVGCGDNTLHHIVMMIIILVMNDKCRWCWLGNHCCSSIWTR